MLPDNYLQEIKRFEGYNPKAYADYAQLSNGYGTKAKFPGEVVDHAEAERRFKDEIQHAEKLVDRFAPGLEVGVRAALTSLTYNAGTRWMSSGLGEAIQKGDIEGAVQRFVQYNKAGGEVLPGLVSRRLQEVAWISSTASVPVNSDADPPPATMAAVAVPVVPQEQFSSAQAAPVSHRAMAHSILAETLAINLMSEATKTILERQAENRAADSATHSVWRTSTRMENV